jgi:hypothetical protein
MLGSKTGSMRGEFRATGKDVELISICDKPTAWYVDYLLEIWDEME